MSFPCPLPTGSSGLLLTVNFWASLGILATVDDISVPFALDDEKVDAGMESRTGYAPVRLLCFHLTQHRYCSIHHQRRSVSPKVISFLSTICIDLSRTPSLGFSQVISTRGEYTDKAKSGGFLNSVYLKTHLFEATVTTTRLLICYQSEPFPRGCSGRNCLLYQLRRVAPTPSFFWVIFPATHLGYQVKTANPKVIFFSEAEQRIYWKNTLCPFQAPMNHRQDRKLSNILPQDLWLLSSTAWWLPSHGQWYFAFLLLTKL